MESSGVLVLAGEHERAIAEFATLMRVDPFYSALVPYWLGLAHHMLEQYARALPLLRESVTRAPQVLLGPSWLGGYLRTTRQL
jgi:hypothetical protein